MKVRLWGRQCANRSGQGVYPAQVGPVSGDSQSEAAPPGRMFGANRPGRGPNGQYLKYGCGKFLAIRNPALMLSDVSHGRPVFGHQSQHILVVVVKKFYDDIFRFEVGSFEGEFVRRGKIQILDCLLKFLLSFGRVPRSLFRDGRKKTLCINSEPPTIVGVDDQGS